MQTMPNKIAAVSVRAASTGEIGTFNAFEIPKGLNVNDFVELRMNFYSINC